jgi:hypothetical protein
MLALERFLTFFAIVSWSSVAFGQQFPGPPTTPLSPEEERTQQVRTFDPLDPRDLKPRDSKSIDAQSAAAGEQPDEIAGNEDVARPVQEYTGPAVLSRTYSANRPLAPQPVKWTESIGFSDIYYAGIGNGTLNPSSASSRKNGNGEIFDWNIVGRRFWRHDQLGVSYYGDVTHSPVNTGNASNQSLSLDYTHVLTRRLSLTLTEFGSVYSQNYTLAVPAFGLQTVSSINLASSPNIQIFDNGTRQFASQADLTWQKTARLSFNGGIGYFAIERTGPGLIGVGGREAHGDVNYRLTRKTTIGTYYSFARYIFPHGSGSSDANALGLVYSYAFSKSMQLRLRVGSARVESIGLTVVPIDPVTAALLGQSAGIIDLYRKVYTGDFSGQFLKSFRKGTTVFGGWAKGLSPGNGVWQTSSQQSISAGASMKVAGGYIMTLGVSHDQLAALAQAVGKFKTDSGQVSISRTYRRGISFNLLASWRHYEIAAAGLVPTQLAISSGLTWSPGEGRLIPW